MTTAPPDYVGMILEDPEKDAKQYGVLGMKWGVRKSRRKGKIHTSNETDPSDGKTKPHIVNKKTGRYTPVSKDHLQTQAVKKHASEFSLAAVSNKDLQAAITRLNLEANYRKAMAANAPPPSPLKAWLKKYATSEGKKFAEGKPTTTEDILSMIKVTNAGFQAAKTGNAPVKKAIGAGVQAHRVAQAAKNKKKK